MTDSVKSGGLWAGSVGVRHLALVPRTAHHQKPLLTDVHHPEMAEWKKMCYLLTWLRHTMTVIATHYQRVFLIVAGHHHCQKTSIGGHHFQKSFPTCTYHFETSKREMRSLWMQVAAGMCRTVVYHFEQWSHLEDTKETLVNTLT